VGGGLDSAVALLAASAGGASLGGIEQWVDIEILQKLVRHSTTVVAAVLMFWLVGILLRRMLHEGYFKRIVILIDEFVLFALLAFLGWEIISLLIRRLLESGAH
jgi:hypothetical protein